MSKTTVKINRINNKLNEISGLDGNFVQEKLDNIEKYIDVVIKEINSYNEINKFSCTIFENNDKVNKEIIMSKKILKGDEIN